MSSSPIHPVVAELAAAADADRLSGTGLLAALAQVPDPRKRRGVRHSITTMLALAVGAVLAGARSFTAIGEWAANASGQILTALEAGGYSPCESTLRRTLQRPDGDKLDSAIGGWATARTEPSTARQCAARPATPTTPDICWPRSTTAAELSSVNATSTPRPTITRFSCLCEGIATLTDAIVTADALPTQRHHADYLVLERGAPYLLTVKANQPGLHNQLKALPWEDGVPPAHTSADRAHGRVEQRIVKAVTVQTRIVFPHACQAIQITRKTRRLDSKKWTTETVYAITSLTAEQTTATELASWIRGHWAIENRLHWV